MQSEGTIRRELAQEQGRLQRIEQLLDPSDSGTTAYALHCLDTLRTKIETLEWVLSSDCQVESEVIAANRPHSRFGGPNS